MASYNLGPDEALILQNSSVSNDVIFSSYTDEIILTNMNFIYVNKSMFGKVKKVMKYPLDSIKVYQGVAQALATKSKNGTEALQINFLHGEEIYCFQSASKKEIAKWVNAINQVITGSPSPYIQSENDEGGFVGAIKEAFGIKKEPKINFSEEPIIVSKAKVMSETGKITKKCVGCMAPLSGRKGDFVKCKYCDTEQTL